MPDLSSPQQPSAQQRPPEARPNAPGTQAEPTGIAQSVMAKDAKRAPPDLRERAKRDEELDGLENLASAAETTAGAQKAEGQS